MAGEAVVRECTQVLRGAVAFVAGPGIQRVAHGEQLHQAISHGLRDDGGGGDRMAMRVAVDDRFVRAPELGGGEAVDENEVRRAAEPTQRPPHGQDGGAPDVEPVDLPHARGAHGNGERPRAHDPREPRALTGREQLGIAQAADRLAEPWKHDGRGHHWTGQGAPACFVEAGDKPTPRTPERQFALERGAGSSHACCGSVPGTVTPRFSRMRAALPASRRRKYNLARRTRPLRTSSIAAIAGECSGKIRSTPTPAEILRTVNVSLMPPPRRPMHTPSKARRRSFSPSRTRTITRTVSPGSKGGRLVFNPSRSIALSRSIPLPSILQLRPEIRAPCARQPLSFRRAPRRNPFMVTAQQYVGDRHPAILRRPGVTRRRQQAVVVRVRRRRFVVPTRDSMEAYYPVEDTLRRRFPTRQHEVSDRDLFGPQAVGHALVYVLVVAAQ